MAKKPLTVHQILTKSTSRAIATMFMRCYKRGVNDARLHSDDDGLLREHLARTEDNSVFGFIGMLSPNYIYWRNRLCEAADECHTFPRVNAYFERAGRFGSNFLSVAYIIAQVFYNRGITDYMAAPYGDIAAFNENEEVRLWWDGDRGRKFDFYRLRAYIQDICAIRQVKIEEGGSDPLRTTHYSLFSTAFSFALVAHQ